MPHDAPVTLALGACMEDLGSSTIRQPKKLCAMSLGELPALDGMKSWPAANRCNFPPHLRRPTCTRARLVAWLTTSRRMFRCDLVAYAGTGRASRPGFDNLVLRSLN